MDAQRDKTISMVQKLLALAASTPYEEEAAEASRKAGDLLARSGLSVADVTPSTTRTAGVGASRVEAGKLRMPVWQGCLAKGVAEAFDAKVFVVNERPGKAILFVGTVTDLKLCEHFFAFLKSEVDKASESYSSRHWNSPHRASEVNAFRHAMVAGLNRRLKALREARNQALSSNSMALVVVKEGLISRYVSEQFSRPRAGRRFKVAPHQKAMEAGIAMAQQIQLNDPVEAGPRADAFLDGVASGPSR